MDTIIDYAKDYASEYAKMGFDWGFSEIGDKFKEWISDFLGEVNLKDYLKRKSNTDEELKKVFSRIVKENRTYFYDNLLKVYDGRNEKHLFAINILKGTPFDSESTSNIVTKFDGLFQEELNVESENIFKNLNIIVRGARDDTKEKILKKIKEEKNLIQISYNVDIFQNNTETNNIDDENNIDGLTGAINRGTDMNTQVVVPRGIVKYGSYVIENLHLFEIPKNEEYNTKDKRIKSITDIIQYENKRSQENNFNNHCIWYFIEQLDNENEEKEEINQLINTLHEENIITTQIILVYFPEKKVSDFVDNEIKSLIESKHLDLPLIEIKYRNESEIKETIKNLLTETILIKKKMSYEKKVRAKWDLSDIYSRINSFASNVKFDKLPVLNYQFIDLILKNLFEKPKPHPEYQNFKKDYKKILKLYADFLNINNENNFSKFKTKNAQSIIELYNSSINDRSKKYLDGDETNLNNLDILNRGDRLIIDKIYKYSNKGMDKNDKFKDLDKEFRRIYQNIMVINYSIYINKDIIEEIIKLMILKFNEKFKRENLREI